MVNLYFYSCNHDYPFINAFNIKNYNIVKHIQIKNLIFEVQWGSEYRAFGIQMIAKLSYGLDFKWFGSQTVSYAVSYVIDPPFEYQIST